jgi:hypothetical protein
MCVRFAPAASARRCRYVWLDSTMHVLEGVIEPEALLHELGTDAL